VLLKEFGLPRERVLLYAWNPLVIWQFAGDGHVDAAAIALVAAALFAHARRRDVLTGIALGAATLVKLYPGILFPALYRRWSWQLPAAMAATIVAGYLPYAGAGIGVLGFLPGYLNEEGLLSGEGFLLLTSLRRMGATIPTAVYATAAAGALLMVGYARSQSGMRTALADVRRCLAVAAAFILLLSPHYPWYYAWLVALLCFARRAAVLSAVTCACALFVAMAAYGAVFTVPDEKLDFNVPLLVPLAILVLYDRFGAARAHEPEGGSTWGRAAG
jgi:hypothetical protein